MLVIRLQRTGRKGHAQFRVVVQDSRRTPTSGKIVALIGTYDPHTKNVTLNKERAAHYLEHGAQPSDRVVRLLEADGIELPKWVTKSNQKASKTRNPEKLRKNQPAEEPEQPVVADSATEATPKADDQPAETAEVSAEVSEPEA